MKLRTVIITLGLAYSSCSFAMFCPNSFNQISLGDTMAQVALQCGKADSENKYKSAANQPQEWSYYLKLNPTDVGTMKITFAFIDDKVTNMTSNGIGVGATTICGGASIQLGNSTSDVEKACGKPALVTQTNVQGADTQAVPPTEIVEWTYNGTPNITLIFENGKLTERQ